MLQRLAAQERGVDGDDCADRRAYRTAAQRFIDATGADIRYGGDRVMFVP